MNIVFVMTMVTVLLHATALGMTDQKADEKNLASATEGVAALALQSKGDDEDIKRKNSFFEAVMCGDYAQCKEFIEAGYPVDMQGACGNTLLHVAVIFNHPNILKLLLDEGKATIDKRNEAGYTPLRVAYHNSKQALRILIKRGAKTEELKNLEKLTIKVTAEVAECRYRIHFLQEFSYDQVPVETTVWTSADHFREECFRDHDADIVLEFARTAPQGCGYAIPGLAISVYERASVDIKATIQTMLEKELGCVPGAEALAAMATEDLVAAKKLVDQKDTIEE